MGRTKGFPAEADEVTRVGAVQTLFCSLLGEFKLSKSIGEKPG